jgi:Ca-activated chloride channel family protein
MSFSAPERLWLLAALAVLAGVYVALQLRRGRYALRFTNLRLLERVAPARPGWRRHLPAALFLLMVGLFITGFAKPTKPVQVPREQATIMMAVDVSSSMQATDVTPDRLSAAKAGARAFLARLPARFNVGLVAFSGQASVIVPPTTDRLTLRTGIDSLSLGPRTAIGEGIFSSLQAISNFRAQLGGGSVPARIVLLSDGTNTAGRPPAVAAEEAVRARVPVSTIAYGTPEGTITIGGEIVPVPVDGPALEQLAQSTGGRYYTAESGPELRQVYQDIGSSVGYRTVRRDISGWLTGFGLLAACVTAIASLAWFSRLP